MRGVFGVKRLRVCIHTRTRSILYGECARDGLDVASLGRFVDNGRILALGALQLINNIVINTTETIDQIVQVEKVGHVESVLGFGAKQFGVEMIYDDARVKEYRSIRLHGSTNQCLDIIYQGVQCLCLLYRSIGQFGIE